MIWCLRCLTKAEQRRTEFVHHHHPHGGAFWECDEMMAGGKSRSSGEERYFVVTVIDVCQRRGCPLSSWMLLLLSLLSEHMGRDDGTCSWRARG